MVQHRDEATARAVRQFSKSAENGASVRSWLEDSQHERYMVVSFPGAWERTYLNVCIGGHVITPLLQVE